MIELDQFLELIGLSFDSSPTDFSTLLNKSLEELFDPERTNGLDTGYKQLNKLTGGLLRDHLYMLVAETGMGKSVFSANLIINILANNNVNCSYFDLENGKFASMARFICIKGLLNVSTFKDQTNKEIVGKIADQLKGRLIYRDHEKLSGIISDSAGLQMAKSLGELITQDVKDFNTKLVVIDPLENFELAETDYNSISKVVIFFKDLAQKLGISIVILHHLRKPDSGSRKMVEKITDLEAPKYRIPSIHDALGSSKITNMATDVWALVRQKEAVNDFEKGKILVRVLKSREANLGDVILQMNMNNLKITDPVKEYYSGQFQIESYEKAN
jgi:replicative DNA helicase